MIGFLNKIFAPVFAWINIQVSVQLFWAKGILGLENSVKTGRCQFSSNLQVHFGLRLGCTSLLIASSHVVQMMCNLCAQGCQEFLTLHCIEVQKKLLILLCPNEIMLKWQCISSLYTEIHSSIYYSGKNNVLYFAPQSHILLSLSLSRNKSQSKSLCFRIQAWIVDNFKVLLKGRHSDYVAQ